MPTKLQILAFQSKILAWYSQNKRDLPWRHITDPYKILVSEVMSQQTQISRVIPKYNQWVSRFPTIQDLARASTTDVLTYWSGLGFNRRALNLQKIAQVVMDEYSNVFPQDVHILESLPGIGKYTASAVMCFAYNTQIAVIDTNVKKIILTQFLHAKSASNSLIESIANQLLPEGKAVQWNQALMDYAALELRSEKIIVPKQSTFKTSRRYYRGQIIKMLVQDKKLELIDFNELFKGSPYSQDEIIAGLLKDGLIRKEENILTFP